jgi:hypothetical protein
MHKGGRRQQTVYVVEDGVVKLKRIKIGSIGASMAQVTEGLMLGDIVIKGPSEDINVGGRVSYAD